MVKETEPQKIELTEEEITSLKERIKQKTLSDKDIVLFGQLLCFMLWIQQQLERFKLTTNKLRKMLFGNKTEKSKASRSSKNKSQASNDSHAASSGDQLNNTVEGQQTTPSNQGNVSSKQVRKGHGRMGAKAYNPDEVIQVHHMLLKPGDPCPSLCGGKLYALNDDPGIVIRIKGQSCAHVIRYEFDKLRCALCQEVFTAEVPEGFPAQKYDEHFKANLVVQKYFMASPFYRQERYQKLLGLPLPDSTQWDLVESVADCAYPILAILERKAANSIRMNHDDTKVKILDVIRANQLAPLKKRKGTFTTCILTQSNDHTICLYYSGIQHSGENVTRILAKRDSHLPPIIRMCDALAANVPAALKTILCHCLAHGRRKFTDIEAFFPDECSYVIEQLALVYKHDAEAKEQSMSADERLQYHQAARHEAA